MRILFATTSSFIPDYCSGQNTTLRELAIRLVAMGHEPVILAGPASSQSRSAIVTGNQQGFRLFRAANPIKHLQALCLTLQPDVVVVADGDYQGLIKELKPLKVPVAVWFFLAEPDFFTHGAPDEDLLYMGSSRFVVDRLFSLFGIHAEALPPYIEAKNYRGNSEGERVLFVNPVRQKGMEIAFSLAERRTKTIFTFVESWKLSEQWRRYCFERAARCGNVEWLPAIHDISTVFKSTRLLLVPRYSEEGFCRLVTEAQQGGIPVLASNRGYLPENVGSGGSVLDLDAGIDAWLEQLDRYLSDDDYHRCIGEAARSHAARDEISAQAVVERLLELLTAQIGRHSVRRFGTRGR